MKTQGMAHQLEALRRMNGKPYYGLLMEQGTGKTWALLADAERMYSRGLIDGVFVVAPNGVHSNWIKREIPAHMEGNIIARFWRSGPSKKHLQWVEQIFTPREPNEPPPLRILAMSLDAVITKSGREFAERFLNATNSVFILDESSSIKNPTAVRTEVVMSMRKLARAARIADGTPITKAPVDLFQQMEFLYSGLLGTTSYRAFMAEYAELIPMAEAYEVIKKFNSGQAITPYERQVLNSVDYGTREKMKRNPRMQYAQIVERDASGAPKWRNLERLTALLEPHTFRVLKKHCLDLPEKIYKTITFELSSEQQKAYDKMQKEFRIEITEDSSDDIPVSELAALSKLQQITSGFVKLPETGVVHYVSENNPRLKLLMDTIKFIDGKFIVWAKFHEELDAIKAAMEAAGIETVSYHGRIGQAEKEDAIERLQNGTARCFLGHAQAGGIGLTLTAAETAIYFSCDFNLRLRLQSEDRCHRIGTKNNVVYIDLAAEDTIDEGIAANLQRKKRLAALVLGDD